MGRKLVCFEALGGTRSRQGASKEVHEVGSKRPSSGGIGGHVLSLYPLIWRSLRAPPRTKKLPRPTSGQHAIGDRRPEANRPSRERRGGSGSRNPKFRRPCPSQVGPQRLVGVGELLSWAVWSRGPNFALLAASGPLGSVTGEPAPRTGRLLLLLLALSPSCWPLAGHWPQAQARR
jgi:hypothetical protein